MTGKSKRGVDVGSEIQGSTPQAAQTGARRGNGKRQGNAGAASPAPGRTGKPHTKQKRAPGKVVAIGVDVPKLDDLKAEEAAREQFERAKPDGYEFGRPTDYRPEYAVTARALCSRGASDMELAQEFEVSTSTIWYWRCKYPDFSSALTEGKDAFEAFRFFVWRPRQLPG